jgi:ADP-ribose pyrophosphatase YjhB (NUDIX family)
LSGQFDENRHFRLSPFECSAQAAQSARLKFWTLPSGKRGESFVKALKREVYEKTALRLQIGSLLGVLDRRDKDAIALLLAGIQDSGCRIGRS